MHRLLTYTRGADSLSPRDLVALKAMQALVDQAGNAFGAAQTTIDEAERRIQKRQASRRFGVLRRMGP
jgi:hypothetical protein